MCSGQGHKTASFLLVDVPGHPKVRGQAAGYYRAARCIIFVVDAVEFLGQKAEVAEQLYEVSDSPEACCPTNNLWSRKL